MAGSDTGARLIIVCGLPGSGKTTHAKALQAKLRAIRLSPDEWMDALGIDLYDETQREKVEALQWQLGQELLKGLVIIIEWVPGEGASEIHCDSRHRLLGLQSSCTTSLLPWIFSTIGFDAGAWRVCP
jgi:predicted kinase